MVSGSIKAQVLSVKGLSDDSESMPLGLVAVRVRLSGNNIATTNGFTLDNAKFDEILTLDFQDLKPTENLLVEVIFDATDKPLATTTISLDQLTQNEKKSKKDLKLSPKGSIEVTFQYSKTVSNNKQSKTKVAATGATSSPETSASIPRTLSTTTGSKDLWYIHPSFYYEKTKEVYVYATSFAGISYLARYGETTLEYLLTRINPKTSSLKDVDQALTPALTNVDSKLDENVTYLLKKLIDGQDYLVSKKDAAVHGVYQSANTTKAVVKDTVNKTGAKINEMTTKAIDVVNKTRESTVETLSSASQYVWSYVPFTGSSKAEKAK